MALESCLFLAGSWSRRDETRVPTSDKNFKGARLPDGAVFILGFLFFVYWLSGRMKTGLGCYRAERSVTHITANPGTETTPRLMPSAPWRVQKPLAIKSSMVR